MPAPRGRPPCGEAGAGVLFTTVDFAVFFTTVLALSWLVPAFGTRWKLLVLLASYVFYSWWDWRFSGLLAASTALNQAAAEAIARRRSARTRPTLLRLAAAAALPPPASFT